MILTVKASQYEAMFVIHFHVKGNCKTVFSNYQILFLKKHYLGLCPVDVKNIIIAYVVICLVVELNLCMVFVTK